MKKHLLFIAILAFIVSGCKPEPEEVKLEQNQMYVQGVVYNINSSCAVSSSAYFADALIGDDTINIQSFRFDIDSAGINKTIDLSVLTENSYAMGIDMAEFVMGFDNHYPDCLSGYINEDNYETQSVFKSGELTTSNQGGLSIIINGVLVNDEELKVNFFVPETEYNIW